MKADLLLLRASRYTPTRLITGELSIRLALAQINTSQGDLERNLERHLRALSEAHSRGADLLVFPELSLCGYCPRDLLLLSAFREGVRSAETRLIAAIPSGMSVVFGSISPREAGHGPDLYNVGVVVKEGEVVARIAKRLMPTYDVFDETRYFANGADSCPVDLADLTVGVTICEDFWSEEGNEFVSDRYDADPPSDLVNAGASILLNLSASPFHDGKSELREEVVRRVAMRTKRPVALCNLVGGNDEILFDGASMVIDSEGRTIARAKSFEEDLIVVELDAEGVSAKSPSLQPFFDTSEGVFRALVMGLGDYARKSGFKTALIGLSGGIDSALTAVIAAHALGPENVLGVAMPSCYSADMSEQDARALTENLGMEYSVLPIEEAREAFTSTLSELFEGHPNDITEENLQARIRGTLLMALSNKFNRLLLTTGNKSEVAVGYCTLYGDMCGGLAVISDVPKMLVFQLSRWINRHAEVIPWRTIERPPSAELKPDQVDTDSLPNYEILDDILHQAINNRLSPRQIIELGYDEKVVTDVLRRLWLNEYKRKQMPPGLRVTSKAFGVGRRMPITGHTSVVVRPPQEGSPDHGE